MGPLGGIGAGASVRDIIAMRSQILERSQTLKGLDAKTPAALPDGEGGAGGSFADTLKTSLQGVNDSQQRASRLSEAYERGQVTDVASVMLARQEAGVAFEATLQVRNKLLNAYQEIMRMGV